MVYIAVLLPKDLNRSLYPEYFFQRSLRRYLLPKGLKRHLISKDLHYCTSQRVHIAVFLQTDLHRYFLPKDILQIDPNRYVAILTN